MGLTTLHGKPVLGVGLLVNQKMKPAVIGFENISERLSTLRLRDKFRNIGFINVHAENREERKLQNLLDSRTNPQSLSLV